MPEGARRTRKGPLAALDRMPTNGVLVARGRPGERSFAVIWLSGLRRHTVVLGRERDGWTERSAARALGFSALVPTAPSEGAGAHPRRVRRIEKKRRDDG